MIGSRYSVLPNPGAVARLDAYMSICDIGLRKLVLAILRVENGLDHVPETFERVVSEELTKSGLSEIIIEGDAVLMIEQLRAFNKRFSS